MADGHISDVELLRRELAALILEWAGKAVKDDPDGPLSTALSRAVGEAARSAVSEQHQALSADAADRIAEALDRRGKVGHAWLASPWTLGLIALASAALLGLAFLLGLQIGRAESPAPTEPAVASAPIAPLAAAADAPPHLAPPPATAKVSPTPRPERAAPPPAKPRPAVRDQGRPAQANDKAPPPSAQPVGAAPTDPAASTVPKTP